MASSEDTGSAEEESLTGVLGKKRYGRMARMFREGFLSICVYKNVYEKRTFYDVVIYRKIKSNEGYDYKRGANLKPSDLPVLSKLLDEVHDFLSSINREENPVQ